VVSHKLNFQDISNGVLKVSKDGSIQLFFLIRTTTKDIYGIQTDFIAVHLVGGIKN